MTHGRTSLARRPVASRGFSLIEVIVTALGASVILLGLWTLYGWVVRANAEATSQVTLQRQGALIIDEMNRQIRAAATLDTGACHGANSITATNTSGDIYCFYLEGGQIKEDRTPAGGGSGTVNLLQLGLLAPASLQATSFTSSTVGTPPNSVNIQFQIKYLLRAPAGPATDLSTSMTFATTVSHRN